MAIHRFKFIGPNTAYLQQECATDGVSVVSPCDGPTMDIDVPNNCLDTVNGIMAAPNHFAYVGPVL